MHHNSRTFVHKIAHELGVGENYRKLVSKFRYLAALDLSLVTEESIDSIFKEDGSIFLTGKEKTFLENVLPLDYNFAKWEYQLGGSVTFNDSMRDKKGSMIIVETKKGIKFGGFFASTIKFTNGVVESHSDEHAVLFNITSEMTFPI